MCIYIYIIKFDYDVCIEVYFYHEATRFCTVMFYVSNHWK